MTRYRRPEPAGSKYATAEGARRLREELDYLWRVHRPQVTRAVAEAAAQGDRSENAEYIYGKKQLREIDRRVRYLRKRLDGLVIMAMRIGDEDAQRLSQAGLEVVLIENHHPLFSGVEADNVRGGALAAEHFAGPIVLGDDLTAVDL